MHPPTNAYVDLNEFIKKHDTLQDITLEGLPKNVIPIVLISKTFQCHHQIPQSNTSKTFNINRYQLWLAPIFCLIDFKSQGQTFDHLIINLKQPPNNVLINTHNIYVTLSQLRFSDGLVILKDISIKDICKAKFKKKSSKMTKPLPNQKKFNTNGIKTNKDIEIPMNSNIDPKKCDDNLLHDILNLFLQY
jgi:hypothetical protein